MRTGFAIALLALAAPLALGETLNNDDSCDISTLPAATLLLPYFEVDLDSMSGENTFFTVTNVTQSSVIARVTLWTDWSYPVFSFNVFLTGYDVQSMSLYDVLHDGAIAPPDGTSWDAPLGDRSVYWTPARPLELADCYEKEEMARVPPAILSDLRNALTTGTSSSCGTKRIGSTHAATKAIGYATIDVVRNCASTLPSDDRYFTHDILFDNALTGDYQQLNAQQGYAQGGTMVHIRAIPEGLADGATPQTFARTFYSRVQGGGTRDRRQPLPSVFAARWISGGAGGFNTSFKIWREGTADAAGCGLADGMNDVADVVRFDEEENPTQWTGSCCCITCPPEIPAMSGTGKIASYDTALFPPNPGGDIAGWMYVNADEYPAGPAKQGWVIVSMAAEGRFSADVDAVALGNGCSAAAEYTSDNGDEPAIAPAQNDNGNAPAALAATIDNDDSCDLSPMPAATLLLPYFEVDTRTRDGVDTLFTVTNVSQLPQIAHVTMWTDLGYPVIDFNIFLTGYDVQAISIYDLLGPGLIAPPDGTTSDDHEGRRSLDNDDNPLLDIANCDVLARKIPISILTAMRRALVDGVDTKCGGARVGSAHANGIARGFITIDVVESCNTDTPVDASYYTGELLYDNVLIGDYQQIDRRNNSAQSGALVHIRAIPEGGSRLGATTELPRTFYAPYQNGATTDRRQPLPSTFAARWIDGSEAAFQTTFKIWREGLTDAKAGCKVAVNASTPIVEFVRFDEDENPMMTVCDLPITCPPIRITLPNASRIDASDSLLFPPNAEENVAGWMYMNLHNGRDAASQNWVVVSMEAAGRFSVDFDATALGNGCSRPAPLTSIDSSSPSIGPASNKRTP